ncbi:MAG: hypothetical protein J1F23_08380 [Oscillospiraceae bacterium]|nr:hypothetical protein [Oscillospiraceae bacterium]
MFKISATSKRGGIWDGNKVVREVETDDVKTATAMKARGYAVEEFTLALDAMNVPQLKKYAKEHNIDLGEATQKGPILEIIKAAETK